MLTVGDRIPQFKLKATVSLEKGKEFKEITDQDYEGKWRVVFFWPKDFTFVCPTEIAEFGKRNKDFDDRDAQVLGASHRHRVRAPRVAEGSPGPARTSRSRCSRTSSASCRTALGDPPQERGRGAARDLHRRPRGHHPLGERERPLGRPERRRGAPHPRRAPDRRALPVQLEEGRRHPRRWPKPMSALETLRERLPDAAKDIKLNLQSVLSQTSLSANQQWGVAIASALAARNPELQGRGDRGGGHGGRAGGRRGREGRRRADGDEQRLLPVPAHDREARPTRPSRPGCG